MMSLKSLLEEMFPAFCPPVEGVRQGDGEMKDRQMEGGFTNHFVLSQHVDNHCSNISSAAASLEPEPETKHRRTSLVSLLDFF